MLAFSFITFRHGHLSAHNRMGKGDNSRFSCIRRDMQMIFEMPAESLESSSQGSYCDIEPFPLYPLKYSSTSASR